ncbi:hypothetical protein CsSME_00035660 [Camellia sinensis var. sinensis]
METSHLPITAHKLNGQNYLQWSQSILMFIRGKEKDDYITGASALPETTASTYKRWIAENNMVMSWLVNSMTTDIGENFLSCDTAKEIWDMAKETFSDKENTSEIIQLESSLHNLRQDNLTVTEYFNTLTRLWRQLDTFEVHNWQCVADGLLYKKIVEGKRVFKFLLGLNTNLDEIRGRIMGVKPLPSLRESQSGSSSNHIIGSGTLAHKGNSLNAFTVNGSLSKVAGTGSVVLSRNLILNSDLDSGKTIGNAEECSGLYILKERHYPQEQPQTAICGEFLAKEGIVHLSSCVDTPQQNGIAERKK